MKGRRASVKNPALEIGKRVWLRWPTANDCEEFLNLMRASVRLHKGVVYPPTQPERFIDYVNRSDREDHQSYLVCRTEDERIVGVFSLSQIYRGGFQSAYLGYYVGEPFASRGYMTEALRLVLRRAFRELKLHRLEANIQPGNVASISLVRRAGFVREGYSKRYLKIGGKWRDHERWAILTEDWRSGVSKHLIDSGTKIDGKRGDKT